MLAKSLRAAVLGLLAIPSAALALGLGDIRLNSALNSPLDAEIELIGAAAEDLASLHVTLASRETFARYGLERPAFLGSVAFETTRSGGRDVIRVRTTETATEPFVTLLIEAAWAKGRLVREYTVLLDPPVYAPAQAAAAAPVAAPVAGAGPRSGAIQREAAATPEAAAERPAAPPAAAGARDQSYTVRRGDSLSSIARQLSDEASPRLMVGLYRANPEAFAGDMNSLRTGAILRVPGSEELAAITGADAAAEVRRQYAAWRARTGTADTGRLRLVTPAGDAGSTTTAAAGAAETQGLRDRIAALESELSQSKRLIELRNSELAELQAKLAAAQRTPAAAPAAEPPVAQPAEAPAATAPAEEDLEVEAPAAAEAPPVAAAIPEEAPVAAEPAAEEDAAPATQSPSAAPSAEEGASLLDTLKAFWFVPVLLLALAGGLFGYRWFRARQQAAFDEQLGELAASPEAGDTATHDLRLRHDTARMHKPVLQEESFLVEESGSHERPRIDLADAPHAPRAVAADETISGETAINFDQGDPLAEADFHMAYGLYDQAADLIRIASAREPQRRDLKLKLLEVFFVWGNREQFLQTARELAGTRADAAPGEWEKVVIMGKQIAPDDALFAHDAVTGAAAGGIDLNLEGGQNRVDFELFGEPSSEQPAAADVDLGIGGAELGDGDPTGEALTIEAGEVDFPLDDGGAETDHSGLTTREMTAQLQPEPTVSLAEFNESSEAPTVEQPALRRDEMSTLVDKLEGARRQVTPGEQTAELAIDDLGLDLGALDRDESGIPADSEAPTMVAGLDERSRQLMAEAEGRAEGGAAPSDSGTWFLGSPDLAAAVAAEAPEAQDAGLTASLRALEATEIAPPLDVSETSRLQAIDAESLDLDFGRMDETRAPAGNGAELDLDVGAATELAESPFAATQQVAAEELALPDLEPVTMSEVGTKLDLARAYMDMGDPEGARSILDEVLHEGSVSQKQEAQRLIESLPG